MSSLGASGQSFGSSSTTIAASSGASTHTAKASDMASDQGGISSRASSTYTTKSPGTSSDHDEFEDVSKDIELGTLPTTNPRVVKNAPRCGNSKTTINRMRHTGVLELFKVIILAGLFAYAIGLPIDLVTWFTSGIDFSFALALQNLGVVNGTVDYGNGTIAPLNDVNLAGSNLTVSTCNYLTPADLCTNNSHNYFSIQTPCYIIFVVLLYISMFFFVAVRFGVVKIRPGMFDQKDRARYYSLAWPRKSCQLD